MTAAQLVRPKTEVVEMPKETMVEHKGEMVPLHVLAKGAGLNRETLRMRIKSGMPVAEALRMPVSKGGRPPKVEKKSAKPPAAKPEPKPAASSCEAAAVLTRLGFVVEDAGLVPAGRLILVREGAAA